MSVPRCTGKWKEGFNWVLLDKIPTGKTRIYKRVTWQIVRGEILKTWEEGKLT